MSLITPYPKKGELDEWKPGMDDEATPDPDPLPYDADDVPAEEEDEEIPDHDERDWIDPHWEERRGGGVGEDRGSGQGDQSGGSGGEHRGGGDATETGWTDDIDDQVCGHASRFRHLHEIQTIAKTDIRGPIGEQLRQVVANVVKDMGKKVRASMKGNPELLRELNAKLMQTI